MYNFGKVKTMTQKQNILKHLEAGKSLTPLKALGLFGCFRLSARILELRQQGLKIETIVKTDWHGRTYAQYKLVGE